MYWRLPCAPQDDAKCSAREAAAAAAGVSPYDDERASPDSSAPEGRLGSSQLASGSGADGQQAASTRERGPLEGEDGELGLEGESERAEDVDLDLDDLDGLEDELTQVVGQRSRVPLGKRGG